MKKGRKGLKAYFSWGIYTYWGLKKQESNRA